LSGVGDDLRLEREKAVAWLHEQGAVYIRAVFGTKSGWWLDGVFLGPRSVEAAENVRCKAPGERIVDELVESMKRLTGDEKLRKMTGKHPT
jgi:hypothetical protein